MFLNEIFTSIKLCLSRIIRYLRWNKQKFIQRSPFEAHFGRPSKIEYNIIKEKILTESDRSDKEHLERLARTVSQLEKKIYQSRDIVKIERIGQNSHNVSPLFKQQVQSAKDYGHKL